MNTSNANDLTAAERVVVHLLNRVRTDPRFAYYVGPCTESYNLLLAAGAALDGADVETFTQRFEAQNWKTERPRCSNCSDREH